MSHAMTVLQVRRSQGELECPMSYCESRRVTRSQKESGQFRTGHCHIGVGARDKKRWKRWRRGRVVTIFLGNVAERWNKCDFRRMA